MRCSGLRRGSWLRSAGSPLGEGVAAGGSGTDAEAWAISCRCVLPAHALSGLLLGFRQPENEDDGEEEDDRPQVRRQVMVVKAVW